MSNQSGKDDSKATDDDAAAPDVEPVITVEVVPSVPVGDWETRRRVIMVNQVQAHGGSHMTVTTLELYDSGFIVNHLCRPTKNVSGPHEVRGPLSLPLISWSAADDKGRGYQAGRSKGRCDSIVVDGSTEFIPGLPNDTKRLTLSVLQFYWPEPPTGGSPVRERGPWRFEISLK